MRYLFLLYAEELAPCEDGYEDHVAVARSAVEAGAYVSGARLQPATSATTVRVRDEKTLLTDGPVAETSEALTGYYLFECGDLDEAIARAERIPQARQGSVEIRPVVSIPGWDQAIGLPAQASR